jgi:hypothetical protein
LRVFQVVFINSGCRGSRGHLNSVAGRFLLSKLKLNYEEDPYNIISLATAGSGIQPGEVNS